MKKNLTKYIWVVTFFLLRAMHFASAQSASDSLIPCDGTPEHPCGFPELMTLINNLILVFLKYFILPVAVLIAMYGGFLYLTSGDNAGNRTKANRMFRYLFYGLFFCLAAWVIVKIILTTLGYNEPVFSPVISH